MSPTLMYLRKLASLNFKILFQWKNNDDENMKIYIFEDLFSTKFLFYRIYFIGSSIKIDQN